MDDNPIDIKAIKRDDAIHRLKQAVRDGRFEIGNHAAIAHSARADLPRTVAVHSFDHDKAVGLIIQWSEKGLGFGEITIALDRTTGVCRIDTEEMSPDFCARIFAEVAARFAQ